jgi:hypothetical protein
MIVKVIVDCKMEVEMWLSECCGAEPDYRFEVSGDLVGTPVGICSYCMENTGFEVYDEEDEL